MVSVQTKIHRLVPAYSSVELGTPIRLSGRRMASRFERRAEISCQYLMQRIESFLGDHGLKILLRLGA